MAKSKTHAASLCLVYLALATFKYARDFTYLLVSEKKGGSEPTKNREYYEWGRRVEGRGEGRNEVKGRARGEEVTEEKENG